MKIKLLSFFIMLISAVIILSGCSEDGLKGVWVSDADGKTEITFIDDELLTVKSGNAVLDGVYKIENDTINIRLNSISSTETVTATYKIVEKNKLLLTNISGETEQFLRK